MDRPAPPPITIPSTSEIFKEIKKKLASSDWKSSLERNTCKI
jgi:hypothetical protein